MKTSASHPARPHGRLVRQMVNRDLTSGDGRFRCTTVIAPPLVGLVLSSLVLNILRIVADICHLGEFVPVPDNALAEGVASHL